MLVFSQITLHVKNTGLEKDIEQPEDKRSGSDGTVDGQSGKAVTSEFFDDEGKYSDTRKYGERDD